MVYENTRKIQRFSKFYQDGESGWDLVRMQLTSIVSKVAARSLVNGDVDMYVKSDRVSTSNGQGGDDHLGVEKRD